MQKKIVGFLIGIVLLGLLIVVLRPGASDHQELTESIEMIPVFPAIVDIVEESSPVLSPEKNNVVDLSSEQPQTERLQTEQEEVNESVKTAQSAGRNQLLLLIPDWLQNKGEVRQEKIQVAGRWVDRARSRYEWLNGSRVEVEVSDLGEKAAENLFKSLGFNPEIEIQQAERPLRQQIDGEGYLCNLEYDQETLEGILQYVVGGRYLLEVKLQKLPLESFQVLEERDGLFKSLLELPRVTAAEGF